MSDILVDRMKQDHRMEGHPAEKAIRVAAILVISLVLFGSIYFVARMLA